jgi:cell division protein ZapA
MTTTQIEVSILGQPYRLACSPETEGALREAVARVDAEMNKVRNASSVRGTDRIAVMAALSLASELLKLQDSVRHGEAFPAEEIRRTMHSMNEQLGVVIAQYAGLAAVAGTHSRNGIGFSDAVFICIDDFRIANHHALLADEVRTGRSEHRSPRARAE